MIWIIAFLTIFLTISMCYLALFQSKIDILTEIKDRYDELIYAVERKFPDESRHQTALRYIKEAEARANSGGQASQEKKT